MIGNQSSRREPIPPGKRNLIVIAPWVALAVVVATAGWMLATRRQTFPSAEEIRPKLEVEAAQRRAQQALDRADQQSAELAQERSAREVIERAAQRAREQLAREESAREAAERAARQMELQLTEERRAKQAAEQAVREAQAQLSEVQSADKGVAQPPRHSGNQLFSSEELNRVAALAHEKQLPLPLFRIREPAGNVPESMRRLVGIWASDSGFEKTGRQYMLIVTNVLPNGQATGFHIVGPPQTNSTVPARAAFYPLVGRITGNELRIQKTNLDILGVLSSRNELDVTEAWKDGSVGRVLLKPVWRLVDAQRTTKH